MNSPSPAALRSLPVTANHAMMDKFRKFFSSLLTLSLQVQGELGVLRVPSDWLLRLRHNPFYEFLSERTVDWVARGGGPDRLAP